ncbi:MAG TPA: hypothetical protein PK976_07955 [Bacteroidales bacterium]|nr:hypothetical protein [Bacteroidales bacterium]HRC67860.1 hypothetical protein [Bacteroidales bacterium]
MLLRNRKGELYQTGQFLSNQTLLSMVVLAQFDLLTFGGNIK